MISIEMATHTVSEILESIDRNAAGHNTWLGASPKNQSRPK